MAVRPEGAYNDDESRTFALERPPLRPRQQILTIRHEIGIGRESVVQRAIMTDTVPHVVDADDIDKLAVNLGTTATATRPCIAVTSENPHSQFYLNET